MPNWWRTMFGVPSLHHVPWNVHMVYDLSWSVVVYQGSVFTEIPQSNLFEMRQLYDCDCRGLGPQRDVMKYNNGGCVSRQYCRRYITVKYYTILNMIQKKINLNLFFKIWTHKLYLIPTSYGMSLLASLQKRYREISRVHFIITAKQSKTTPCAHFVSCIVYFLPFLHWQYCHAPYKSSVAISCIWCLIFLFIFDVFTSVPELQTTQSHWLLVMTAHGFIVFSLVVKSQTWLLAGFQ